MYFQNYDQKYAFQCNAPVYNLVHMHKCVSACKQNTVELNATEKKRSMFIDINWLIVQKSREKTRKSGVMNKTVLILDIFLWGIKWQFVHSLPLSRILSPNVLEYSIKVDFSLFHPNAQNLPAFSEQLWHVRTVKIRFCIVTPYLYNNVLVCSVKA